MSLDRRSEILRARAERVLQDKSVHEASVKIRAIIGPANFPAGEKEAQAAWQKLRNGEEPSAVELAALELVIRLIRPVPLSRGGVLEDLPEAPGHEDLHPQKLKDDWSAFRRRVQPLLYSIGRVETGGGVHVGTGFLVKDGLLATNRHVLDDLTFGAERLAPGQARVVFQREAGASDLPEHIVAIEEVAAIHPTLDMALLRVPLLGRPVIEMDSSDATEGDSIVAIGYPADDPARNPLFLGGLFKGKWGLKRAALGEVLDGTARPNLFHDCSTTGGNSGSPLFSLASGRAVGLHRGGYFMYRNEALDRAALHQFVAAN